MSWQFTRLLYPYPPTPTSTSRPPDRRLRSTSISTLVRRSALSLSPRLPRTSTSTLLRCCPFAPSPRGPLSPERTCPPRSPLSCAAPRFSCIELVPAPLPPSWPRAPESPPLHRHRDQALSHRSSEPSGLFRQGWHCWRPERALLHGKHSCRSRSPTPRHSTSIGFSFGLSLLSIPLRQLNVDMERRLLR